MATTGDAKKDLWILQNRTIFVDMYLKYFKWFIGSVKGKEGGEREKKEKNLCVLILCPGSCNGRNGLGQILEPRDLLGSATRLQRILVFDPRALACPDVLVDLSQNQVKIRAKSIMGCHTADSSAPCALRIENIGGKWYMICKKTFILFF